MNSRPSSCVRRCCCVANRSRLLLLPRAAAAAAAAAACLPPLLPYILYLLPRLLLLTSPHSIRARTYVVCMFEKPTLRLDCCEPAISAASSHLGGRLL
jgi:hypothetical protein